MQIVIKISEQTYKQSCVLADIDGSPILKAIKNGTPLPKGHGDLIDKSKLVPDCYELEIHDGEDWRNECCGVSLMQIEEYAEVIVKADGGNEDADSN